MDIRPLSVSDMEIPFSVAFHSSLTSIKGEVSLSLGVHPGIHEENCDVVEGEKLLSINWCLGALTSATGNSKATAASPPPTWPAGYDIGWLSQRTAFTFFPFDESPLD